MSPRDNAPQAGPSSTSQTAGKEAVDVGEKEQIPSCSVEVQALVAASAEHGHNEASLQGVLTTVFKHTSFRGHQLDVIQQVLAGKSILAIMPTGKPPPISFLPFTEIFPSLNYETILGHLLV